MIQGVDFIVEYESMTSIRLHLMKEKKWKIPSENAFKESGLEPSFMDLELSAKMTVTGGNLFSRYILNKGFSKSRPSKNKSKARIPNNEYRKELLQSCFPAY